MSSGKPSTHQKIPLYNPGPHCKQYLLSHEDGRHFGLELDGSIILHVTIQRVNKYFTSATVTFHIPVTMKNYHGFFSLPLGLTILIKVLRRITLRKLIPVKIGKILYSDELPLVIRKVRNQQGGVRGCKNFFDVGSFCAFMIN